MCTIRKREEKGLLCLTSIWIYIVTHTDTISLTAKVCKMLFSHGNITSWLYQRTIAHAAADIVEGGLVFW